MTTLDKRLTALESKQASADLAEMTVDELYTHLGTLKAGSPEWYEVLIAWIGRKGSRLPISTRR